MHVLRRYILILLLSKVNGILCVHYPLVLQFSGKLKQLLNNENVDHQEQFSHNFSPPLIENCKVDNKMGWFLPIFLLGRTITIVCSTFSVFQKGIGKEVMRAYFSNFLTTSTRDKLWSEFFIQLAICLCESFLLLSFAPNQLHFLPW